MAGNDSLTRDFNGAMVYLLYMGAFFSCISIAGSNGVIIIMTIFFLIDSYRQKSWRINPKDFSIFAIIYGWKGVTTLANGAFKSFVEIRELWDKFPYFLIGRYKFDDKVVNTTFHTMFGTNAFLIVYSLFQKYAGFPIIYSDLYTDDFRLIGYFGHPLHYGGFISLVIMACVGLALFYNKRYAWYLPFLVTGLALSGSRSYFIGVSVAVVIVCFYKSRKVFYAGIAGIPAFFLLYGILFPSFLERLIKVADSDDPGLRFRYWKIAWDTFKEHPVFGVGYEQFTYYLTPFYQQGLISNTAHAHSLYLEELVEGGVLGLVLIVWMLFYFIRKYFRGFKAEEKHDSLLGALYIGLMGCYFCIAIGGIFEYNFGAAVVWIQLAFLMGLAEGYRKTTLVAAESEKVA